LRVSLPVATSRFMAVYSRQAGAGSGRTMRNINRGFPVRSLFVLGAAGKFARDASKMLTGRWEASTWRFQGRALSNDSGDIREYCSHKQSFTFFRSCGCRFAGSAKISAGSPPDAALFDGGRPRNGLKIAVQRVFILLKRRGSRSWKGKRGPCLDEGPCGSRSAKPRGPKP